MIKVTYPFVLPYKISEDTKSKIYYCKLDKYPVASDSVGIIIKTPQNSCDIFKRMLVEGGSIDNVTFDIVLYQHFNVDDKNQYNTRETEFAIVPVSETFNIAPTYTNRCFESNTTVTYKEILESLKPEYIEWEYINTLCVDNGDIVLDVYRKIRNLTKKNESNT